MVNLQTIQNQLLTDIFSRQSVSQFDTRGIEVYRANLRATASKAIQITYPTVVLLIGKPLVSYATEQLLAIHPPSQGDWAVWGAQLPSFLSTIPALADYPYVADVAKLDYCCHQMVRKADNVFDFQSLTLLNSRQPEDLYIAFNPQLILMTSKYPLVEIRLAHLQPSEVNDDALKLAFREDVEHHYIACHRNGLEVLVQTLSKLEFDWLNTLKMMSLGNALTVFRNTEFSFQNWLKKALETNLLHKIHD